MPRLESRVVVNARSLGHFFETCSFSVEAEEGARSRGEEGAEKQEQGNLSVVYFSANGPIIKEHREYRQTELQCSATVDWEWEEGRAAAAAAAGDESFLRRKKNESDSGKFLESCAAFA